jgi:hypothetical protein
VLNGAQNETKSQRFPSSAMVSMPLSMPFLPKRFVFVRNAAVHNCLVVIDPNAFVCWDDSYAARSAAEGTSSTFRMRNVSGCFA